MLKNAIEKKIQLKKKKKKKQKTMRPKSER